MLADLRRRILARIRWYTLRERALVVVTWVALRLLPARPVAVVHGWPDTEGNAVEVVRALVRRYPGTVCWLRNGDASDAAAMFPDAAPGKVVGVKANTLRAFLISWRAEVTFFTHGLITAVQPPRSRLVVNLWHGDGPKLTPGLPRCRSTVAVAATRLWAREKARLFDLDLDDIAVVGNPRVDSILDRPAGETRRLLGLEEGGDRLALWLPTFRRGSDGGHHSWANGDPLSQTLHGGITVPDGVRLIVKPHPFDTDDYSALGATVLSNQALVDAGVTLMQLLAASDALLSDASSAWVDYLTFDRPIGFFLPDFDAFGALRGYNVPDLPAVLPGPVLRDAREVSRFLEDVRDGAARPPSAHDALGRIGYSAELPVTDNLFTWLDDYRQARGGRRLFTVGMARSVARAGDEEAS